MATGVELATAWIRLVPSVEGITDSIAKEFSPIAAEADKAGKNAATGFAGSWKKYLGAAAITAGVVAAFKGLYEVGVVFDDVADTIRIGTGAVGDDLDAMIEIAKEVGSTLPVEWEDVGQTVADLNTRMGLSGDTLRTVSSQFLRAGQLLGKSVDINKATAAFNAFNIKGDETIDAMDHLFRVSQATGIGFDELTASIQSNAPAVQALGFDFETTAAMVGQFDKAGLNTSQVMMAMSRGLVTLARDGEEPEEAFKRITAEMKSLIESGDKAAAIDLAAGIFGTRAATQFVGAVENGTLAIDGLLDSLGASSDTILDVGEDTDDFAEKWKKFGNKAQVALAPLGEAIFDGLGKAMDWLLPMLDSFSAWISDNQWAIAAFASLIGVTLVAAFAVWTAGIWANTVALLSSPTTWIVLGIMALIAALVLLIMNWDAVVAWVTDVWNGFIGWIGEVTDAFVEWWNGLWENVGNFFKGIWEGAVGFVQGIFDGFIGWITGIIEGFLSIWNGLWEKIGDGFKAVFEGLGKFFLGIWAGIIGAVEGVINFFIDAINALISPIKELGNFLYDMGLGGWRIDLFDHVKLDIPGLANGGTVLKGGTTLVGERGPELLHLPAGAVVDPNIPEFGGGFTVIQNLQPGESPVQLISSLRDRIHAWS